MTELIFCPIRRAENPYHLKSVDMNFYSIEEILWYYREHRILADNTIMEEDFIFWLEEQGLDSLANRLHQMIGSKAPITMFMAAIIDAVNFFDKEERDDFLKSLQEMQDKNEMARRKTLGDQLFDRGRYESAILEYLRVLDGSTVRLGMEEFLAKVHFNLGLCYANLLLYDQALDELRTAFSLKDIDEIHEAVSVINKAMEISNEEPEYAEDNILHLIESGRGQAHDRRWKQISGKMQEYLRSTT